MLLHFGTDGVRGKANTEFTAEFAVRLGRAAAALLGRDDWLIGWDTRASSEMLAGAFCAGVASAGRDIAALGEVPTAAIALACRRRGLPGAMVTASHNLYTDNGIKIFGPDGTKLRDDVERQVEQLISGGDSEIAGPDRAGHTGRIRWTGPRHLRDEYRQWLVGRAAAVGAGGLRIGLDCANGAAYRVAPRAVRATGATVQVIGNRPDGLNINRDCGSTQLAALTRLVTGRGLDFGLALDGDADRLLAVDASGEAVDGDQIIAILARHRSARGALARGGVVVTEWSNLGLRNSLGRAGITVEVCAVGDKPVADAMARTGFVLGGEQSGHVIMTDLLQVGDGVSTAIELINAVVDIGRPLREVAASAMTKQPQTSRNVHVAKPSAQVVKALVAEQRAINDELGDSGRLILRASGTEATVVRVLAEAPDWDQVSQIMQRAVGLLRPYAPASR